MDAKGLGFIKMWKSVPRCLHSPGLDWGWNLLPTNVRESQSGHQFSAQAGARTSAAWRILQVTSAEPGSFSRHGLRGSKISAGIDQAACGEA